MKTQMKFSSKPRVLFAIQDSWFSSLFSASDLARLRSVAEVLPVEPPRKANREFLLEHLAAADIAFTSWDTANFDAEVLEGARELRLVCHAAGSVRPIVSDALWEKGVRVSSGASAIAYGVAEFCLGLILTASKRVYWLGQGTREGLWMEPAAAWGGALEIYQQNVGIIGAGFIGRQLIRLLKNFTCNIHVYDPYLSDAQAQEMGVTRAQTLEDLFASCRVVSLNAPSNEGTRDMLRGHHFALLQPGSLFINTAGSIQINEPEFIAELRKGRFIACIDRCEAEPVQLDHPYRTLPNVLLTPHIAGVMVENRLRIGTLVVDEVEHFVSGEALQHEVTRELLARMA